jgi:hypothetical protein
LDGNDSAKQEVISFNTVLDAWSKSSMPQWAEAILEHMGQLHSSRALNTKPTIFSFNLVINCWAKSGRKDAPDVAQNHATAVPCWRQVFQTQCNHL